MASEENLAPQKIFCSLLTTYLDTANSNSKHFTFGKFLIFTISLKYRNRSRNDYYRPARYSPPMKRMRNDYEERGPVMGGRFGMHEYGMYGGYGNSHDPYGALSPYGGGIGAAAPGPREQHPIVSSDGLTQPAMLTLKQFLATQDDTISDDVAITKYNEYKVEFRRSQMNEFFISHKDEEW